VVSSSLNSSIAKAFGVLIFILIRKFKEMIQKDFWSAGGTKTEQQQADQIKFSTQRQW
jgi:hypothetical protein